MSYEEHDIILIGLMLRKLGGTFEVDRGDIEKLYTYQDGMIIERTEDVGRNVIIYKLTELPEEERAKR